MSFNSGSEGMKLPDLSTPLYVLLILTVVGLQFSIALSSIAMGIAIALMLAELARNRGKGFPRSPLDWVFLAYCAAEILATIFSIDPAASAVNAKRLLLISIVYLVLRTVTDEKKLGLLILLAAVVASGLTLYELLTLSRSGEHYFRVSIFQYYLTEAGLKMFVLLLLVPFIVHRETPRRWRIAAVIMGTILVFGLIITQTRSAWLGFIAGCVAIALIRDRRLIVPIAGLIVLFLLFAPADFRARAASMFDPTMKSNLARIHMVTTGWQIFLDYPVTGTGDIDLRALYVTYIEPIDAAEGGHLHNNVMMLLATLGSIGFLVVMFLFWKIFTVEWEAQRSTRRHWLFGSVSLGALAAYVGFHVNGLFEWNFGDHEIAVYLWCTLGLALSAQAMHRREGAP